MAEICFIYGKHNIRVLVALNHSERDSSPAPQVPECPKDFFGDGSKGLTSVLYSDIIVYSVQQFIILSNSSRLPVLAVK